MAVIVRIQGDEKIDFTPSTELLHYEHTYYPQPLIRDINIPVHEVPLEENHFAQFEFDDDTVWFSNSQNIEEIFPGSTIRSRDGDNTTTVVTIPFELGRDIIQERSGGLKRVFLKVVRIFRRKESRTKAIMELATDFESQVLGNEPGLYVINDDFSLTPFIAPAITDEKPYLIFLHGSLSSTFQSFGKLADSSTWKVIKATYGNKVLGFQHRSVTDSPLRNVLSLVRALPRNCTIHIVTQSHGGIVGEVLSRFYNSDGEGNGFKPAEIAVFAAANQHDDINAIAQIAAENSNIKIEKFIRVAAPAAGSTLASDRLDRWLNLLSNLVGLIAGPLYPALRHLIIAALDSKNDPGALPGIQALKPNSAFIQAINTIKGTRVDNALVIISGRSKYFRKRALVILASLFFRDDNDLIVNTDSMYAGTPRTKLVQYKMDEGREVSHLHYFENATTISMLEQALFTIPFGDPIPGFTAREILLARNIPELLATREVPRAPLTLSKLNYINAGPGGTFKPSGNSAFDTTPHDVDKVVETLMLEGTNKVALYFHGGLVSANSGMDTAVRITDMVRNHNKVYPIAFVWETGLIETVVSNLKEIHQTELWRKLLIKVIKIAAKRLGVEILNGFSVKSRGIEKMSEHEIRQELEKPAPFESTEVNLTTRSVNNNVDLMILERQLRIEVHLEVSGDKELTDLLLAAKGPTDKLNLNDDLMDTTSADTKSRGVISTAKIVKALATVIFKSVKRVVQKRDHGFYPTIVEELLREIYATNIGAWIWRQMKDKAGELWHPDNNHIPSDDLSQHTGTYLLRSLNKYGEQRDTEVSVDLVAHSAGSIAVAELMNVLEYYPRLKIRHIIYMAPAITCKQFNESVLSRQDKFQSFRMFTMSDTYEKKDRLASFIYPRSLLYFISGCLEDGGKESDEYILGLQRHLTDQKPYDNVPLLQEIRRFLASQKDRLVLSVTVDNAADGFQSLSESHGGFDNDKGTLQSILHLLT